MPPDCAAAQKAFVNVRPLHNLLSPLQHNAGNSRRLCQTASMHACYALLLLLHPALSHGPIVQASRMNPRVNSNVAGLGSK
jgi:hypothetical protein